MKLGVMQPYFFPYFEYFRLIHHCDKWMAFDSAQYTRKSWMNRNRILNREKGWAYFPVPVVHEGRPVPILRTRIAEDQQWRGKLLDKLRIYQHEAPNYSLVRDMVETVVEGKHASLADLNVSAIRRICTYLGIVTPIERVSEANLGLPSDCGPGEWALEIAKRVGATEYRNPSGGRTLFDPSAFAANGIKLSFHEHRGLSYPTGSFQPIPDLSVIDVMMWNDRDVIHSWLE